MAITRKWLEKNASPMSFERGRELAENQSIEVTQQGLIYHAKIYGEHPYLVQFEDLGTDPTATCTCPFDWGGICKHIVAVGLTIVKGEFETVETHPIISSSAKATPILTNANTFFEDIFLKADLEIQYTFLRQLFTQNPTFIGQFKAYIHSEEVPIDSSNIEKIAEKVARGFSKIPLDIEKRQNRYDDSYYYDEDDGTDWALEKLNKKFNPYFLQGQELLEKGNLMAFLSFQVGVYEGLIHSEEPIYNSDYGAIFPDYSKTLRNIFSEHLHKSFPFLSQMIIQDAMGNACTDLLLYRAETYYNTNIRYDFRDWEAFWMHILQSEGTAQHLLNCLKGLTMYIPEIPRLVMKATHLIGDMQTWAATGEAYCVKNRDISLEILQYYQQKQDIKGLVNVVNKIFTQEQYPDTTFLLNYINPQADRNLYMNVLGTEVFSKSNISLYKKYTELASRQEKEKLIDSIENKAYNRLFYAEVLVEEGEYEKVFPLMERIYHEKDVPAMLKLVVPHLTEKCWEWTKKFVSDKLQDGKRSRDMYNALAQSIALFLSIPAYVPQAKLFAISLNNNYKRLIALKDELERMKLL